MTHEQSSSSTRGSTPWEKLHDVTDTLIGTALPNLRAMGLTLAAEALQIQRGKHSLLDDTIHAYTRTRGYSNENMLAARRWAWPIDRIARYVAEGDPGVASDPLVGPWATMGKDGRYLYPTSEELYAVLGLREARDTAPIITEPLGITITRINQGGSETSLGSGAYTEERYFNSGILGVDLVETTLYSADGSSMRPPAVYALLTVSELEAR